MLDWRYIDIEKANDRPGRRKLLLNMPIVSAIVFRHSLSFGYMPAMQRASGMDCIKSQRTWTFGLQMESPNIKCYVVFEIVSAMKKRAAGC